MVNSLFVCAITDTRGRSEWEKEMVQIQTDYSNLTRERNELNNSYNNLTEKLEQLQTSYNILTRERNELKNSYNILAEEQDQLQKRFEEMNNERKDFQRMIQDKRHCGCWRSFGSKYYYISSEQKTWEESTEDCRQKGTDLVIINSEEEQRFLIALNKRVWIGLTDQEEEGVWKWVDGSALSTRYWLPSQPDNYGEEDCAEIPVDDHDPLLKWNDIPCSQNNFWVCETVDV
uniref:C-type lectin domain-containing protein n=1 Tax=Lates calcarifer TaxID=8187 RepID=A0A4W6CDA8_LATCA